MTVTVAASTIAELPHEKMTGAPPRRRPKRPCRPSRCTGLSQGAKGPPRRPDIKREASISDFRSIWPRHVELAACVVLVLFAAIGNPVSPFANGSSPAMPRAAEIVRDDPGVQRRPKARTALITPARPQIPPTSLREPFGLDTVPMVSGGLLRTWRGVQDALRAESTVMARCSINTQDCPPAAMNFLAIIAEGRAHTGRARIGVINRAINLAIHPKSNPDHWMSPLETLAVGSGDCKDYAIAKYVALVEAGVAEEDLRLVIVRDLALGQDHAIVATRLGQDWIMLDNRWQTLVQDVEMHRVVPLFVLDQDGLREFSHEKTYSNSTMPFSNVARIRGGSRIS
jgi:predicted transglutaminase-like cysteine proteinase